MRRKKTRRHVGEKEDEDESYKQHVRSLLEHAV